MGLSVELAKVVPPEQPLPPLRLLRTVVRNPIESWPREVYEAPVFRHRFLGRDTVFVMDPGLIGDLLVDSAGALDKAEAMRRALEPALGQAILTADGARWRWQRRAAAPIFRHERVLRFVPAMVEAARRTRKRLLSAAGTEIDVSHEMMRTTFDIIIETMLSGRAALDVGRIERAVTEYLESTSWAIALTLLRAPRWVPHPGRGTAIRARDYLRSESVRLVAERRASGERRNDLISLLLEAVDPETSRSMSDREVADNLLTFITAGHETTALALTWTFYLLSLHPEIAERVRREIADVVGDRELVPEDANALPYTRQVLQEAMRLYPPAPLVVRQASREVEIGRERIAAGAAVYIPTYAVHRHRSIWEDPDRFDPDRFRPEAASARHRYAYLPFGAGPRICIGASFALIEALVILATLVPAVRLRLRPGYVPRPKLRVTLRPAAGMPMTLER